MVRVVEVATVEKGNYFGLSLGLLSLLHIR